MHDDGPNDEWREKLAGPVRALQIVAVSLAMGVSTFLGWVVVQGPPAPAARANDLGVSMTSIALSFAAAAV
ncbi:MAG TPA: hypothetical protein VGX78_13595, partial [Pirellulales bacterium]|nr:hypothetical protein [Pirellulales bacterium]